MEKCKDQGGKSWYPNRSDGVQDHRLDAVGHGRMGNIKKQDSPRLTLDGRTLTIQELIHNIAGDWD
jgi:hypothetical protein